MSCPLRRTAPILVGILLSLTPLVVFADPFREQAIPLPWPDIRDVSLADFNGDGRTDVAALDSFGPDFFECYPPPGPIDCGDRMLVTVNLNMGMGRFAPSQSTLAMCAPWTMVAGDFNGDGRADVMIGSQGADDAFGVCWPPSASFYPGDGNGGFGAPSHRVLGGMPTDSAAGDFNGDGIEDVVMIEGDAGVVQSFQVSPAGILTPDAPFNTNFPLNAVAAGNLDDDPVDEIAIVFRSPAHITFMKRSTAGALVPTQGFPLSGVLGAARSLVIADFTLDSVADIALGRSAGGAVGLTLLTCDENGWYGDSELQFDSGMTAGFGLNLAAADLNADGFPDLAATDGVRHFQTLFGDGAGQFAAQVPIATSSTSDAIVAGDLDGDGMSDLVTVGRQIANPKALILALLNETQVTDQMLVAVDGDDLDWYGVFGATGYDVVRGDLQSLRASGGDYVQAVQSCVAGGVTFSAAFLSEDPSPGEFWWILGRPRFPGGPGSYDDWGPALDGPRDPGINASPNACP